MKFSKLMKQIQTLFDHPERQRQQQRKMLKHYLKKLRQKQRSLEQKLADEADNNEQQELRDKIALLKQQRRKLIHALAAE